MQAAIAKRAFAGFSHREYDSHVSPLTRMRLQPNHNTPRVSAHETREESGMEKLLNSLSGTIIAGFVLTVIVVLLIHAIH